MQELKINPQNLKINPQNPDFVSKKSQPLGIITKLQATPINQGLEPNDYNAVLDRAEKFLLKDVSASILNQTEVRTKASGEEYIAYKHRVNYCLNRRITKAKGVDLFYNEKREKAHYGNLQRCGSVWTCPVCSSRITEGRRLEVSAGIKNWVNDHKGAVYMATFTNPHYYGDNLDEQLCRQKLAFDKFWGQRAVKEYMKSIGYKGRIVATEVTHGKNGWHPHYHIIIFLEYTLSNTYGLQEFLAIEWQKACGKAGLKKPSLEHGVDVRDGTFASQYVTKWGMDSEITKGHVKKGREGSLTPWDLLRGAEGNDKYAKLFREFAEVFKGKSQVRWSKGLKSLLGVNTKSDEELATETEQESVKIDEMAEILFDLVRKYKKHAQVLHAVELDRKDNGSRYDDLIMSLAELEVQEIICNAEGG